MIGVYILDWCHLFNKFKLNNIFQYLVMVNFTYK